MTSHLIIREREGVLRCDHCGTEAPMQAHKWSGTRNDSHLCRPLKEILDRALEFRREHLLCERQKA